MTDEPPSANNHQHTSSWGGWLKERISFKAADAVLQLWHEYYIMNTGAAQAPYVKPDELAKDGFPKLEGFTEHFITSENPKTHQKTEIGLWYKKPADDTKPVYVLFHGRTGHWGYCDEKPIPDEGSDPYYRLRWLEAAAANGAGVIAVHNRGFGLSNPALKEGKSGGKPVTAKGFDLSENAFQSDMTAVANFILNKEEKDKEKIESKRLIVAGESFGGALAAMLAETLASPPFNAPPKVLGLLNTFDTLPNAVLPHAQERIDALRARLDRASARLPHVFSRKNNGKGSGDPFLGEKRREITAAEVEQRIPERFYTNKRIEKLKDKGTRLLIAHPPDDQSVPFDHSVRLANVAKAAGLDFEFRPLEGGHMLKKTYLRVSRNGEHYEEPGPTMTETNINKPVEHHNGYVEVPKYPHIRSAPRDTPGSSDDLRGYKPTYEAEMAGFPQMTRTRYPHTSWNPQTVIADLEDMFNNTPLKPIDPLCDADKRLAAYRASRQSSHETSR